RRAGRTCRRKRRTPSWIVYLHPWFPHDYSTATSLARSERRIAKDAETPRTPSGRFVTLRRGVERLVEVFEDVLDGFDADGEADDPLAIPVLQLEGDHRARLAAEEVARERMLRVARHAGIVDPRDTGVRLEPGGDASGVGAVALHPQRQRLDAAQHEPARSEERRVGK